MNRETFDQLEKRLTAKRLWSAAEKRLIEEVGLGEFITIGDAVPEKRDDDADTGNSIRADLVRWFALGGEEGRRPHEKGVRLRGAWITGALDVEACTLPAPLTLGFCRFDAALTFLDAKTKTLNFQGSHLQPEPGADVCFAGDRLRSEGGVFLRSVQATGAVRLLGAKIGGNLSCIAGRFENVGGQALVADRAKVSGSVFFSNEFHSKGEVRLNGADIGSVLSCIAGRFENAGGKALNADGAKVAGSVFLQNGFHATGEVRLNRAEIGGNLDCEAGRFENAGGNALNANGAKVAGALFLRDPPARKDGAAPMFTGALDLTSA